MEKATDNEINARYNDEVLFLDGVMEFHPEIYSSLSEDDKELLKIYYSVGQPVPENIFAHRQSVLRDQLDIAMRAKLVFIKILGMLDIDEFAYSTKFIGRSKE